MDIFKKHRIRRNPLSLQILVAGIVSAVTVLTFASLCIILFSIVDDRSVNLLYILDSMSSFLLGIVLVCVPLNMFSLLFMHFTGLYSNIVYSIKMIILESILFFFLNLVMNIIINGVYIKSILFFSILIQLLITAFIKKIFNGPYHIFQNKIKSLRIQPFIEEKIDIFLAVFATVVFLTPSVLFVLIFFH